MATTTAPPETVGSLLRTWRERRRLTQIELALLADVSTRHLSYVETGRSRPTGRMILHLAEHLEVPLRERNTLLLAGGYAPAYPEHSVGDVPMAAVSEAIGMVLRGHDPLPALVVDRHWELVDANDALMGLIDDVAPYLLEPPVNVLRVSLHPDGMAPRIANLGEWRGHLLDRLRGQFETTGDTALSELHAELFGYPSGDDDPPERPAGGGIVVPLRYRTPLGELSLFSTTTVFGTPLDITVSELAIESFYPADEATAAAFRR
jgi:transcriptional regulator with XRE-family HTH domain